MLSMREASVDADSALKRTDLRRLAQLIPMPAMPPTA